MNPKIRGSKNRPLGKLHKLTFHQLDWLEKISIAVSLWFLFYPKPYALVFTILLIIPILGLILNGLTGNPSIASLVEIKKETSEDTKYDVADFIDLPAFVILFRVLVDFEFESFFSLIIPTTLGFCLILVILFATHKLIAETTNSKAWIYLSLIFTVYIYSVAATYGINCVFDKSEPIVYHSKVLDKRISTGSKGRKTYYLKVAPWGHHYDKEEISVTLEQYSYTEIGQTVKIDLKKGLLNIPWFYIE